MSARSEIKGSQPTAAPPPDRDPAQATPAMGQFFALKADYPECLLFFRMGDFYELFYEDAIVAAEALGIALTKRGKHAGEPIPMCGVPYHSAERYLHDLIKAGHRVAVAEQLEDPKEAKKRGAKAVVERDVVRVVTPGTLTEDALLTGARHNYLAALAEHRGAYGLAWVDLSTGGLWAEVHEGEERGARLAEALARLAPAELLLAETGARAGAAEDAAGARDPAAMARDVGAAVSRLSPASFRPKEGAERTAALFGAAALDAYGAFSAAEAGALGAVADYLALTQRGRTAVLRPPRRAAPGDLMRIDAATRRNLELTRALSGGRAGSLLHVIDRTVTSAGARALETALAAPLAEADAIADRHDAVAYLLDQQRLREDLRADLRGAPDLERALSRLGLGRGGPRDLAAIREALATAAAMQARFEHAKDGGVRPALVAEAAARLGGHDALIETLSAALAPEPPLRLSDGGAVARGYDSDLDEACRLRDRARQVIADLQERYQGETKITSLKVKHNAVLGYFIETPATHAKRMMSAPLAERFRHRQTMANAVRFTTDELTELEAKMSRAADRAAEREREIFAMLVGAVRDAAAAVGETAEALAALDMWCGLAELAEKERWSRPFVDESRAFRVQGGRHPVVEAALRAEGGDAFVANDCDLTADDEPDVDAPPAEPIWLVTGPNMAGKSTFLRQNALIAVLAQMGSYVPADTARIGVVDQLFSRVGAADELARGRSTFMVEMVETAAILNQARSRSLVILDEIGRGTATYDGLSIAWATLEHLQSVNRCRALFATHYHELTTLGAALEGLKNVTVRVREWKGDVVFLREIAPGAADRSYGVAVARLAGMPPTVTARAKSLLDTLENGEDSAAARAKRLVEDLPLFAAARIAEPPAPDPEPASAVETQLAALNPDEMTPREALDALYALKTALDR